MLTDEQIGKFHDSGYLLVPNVLTAEQVQTLRSTLRSKFALPESQRLPSDTDQYLIDVFSRHPDLRWLLFHPPMHGVLRSLLGEDFVILRESTAHFRSFGDWHKDTSAQERAGHTFQWDEDYLMVEAAFYLQDNDAEFGGGLDVEPGSHRRPDEFVRPSNRGFVSRILRKLAGKGEAARKNAISIPSRAGDLVIFHFRLNHCATLPRNQAIPREKEKLAIFIACSRNNRHATAYHDFIKTRSGYEYLKDFSYPRDLLDESARHGVTLA